MIVLTDLVVADCRGSAVTHGLLRAAASSRWSSWSLRGAGYRLFPGMRVRWSLVVSACVKEDDWCMSAARSWSYQDVTQNAHDMI
jgi:hypothetical protein